MKIIRTSNKEQGKTRSSWRLISDSQRSKIISCCLSNCFFVWRWLKFTFYTQSPLPSWAWGTSPPATAAPHTGQRREGQLHLWLSVGNNQDQVPSFGYSVTLKKKLRNLGHRFLCKRTKRCSIFWIYNHLATDRVCDRLSATYYSLLTEPSVCMMWRDRSSALLIPW